jgi:cytochrome oxidase Cu insertion factor (SCO1/SenC/PrrC family)
MTRPQAGGRGERYPATTSCSSLGEVTYSAPPPASDDQAAGRRGGASSRGRRWRGAVAALAALAVIGGGAGAGDSSTAGTAAQSNPNIDLGTDLGTSPAPDFSLVNQFGRQMSLSQFRGQVILLGFEDSECTTVCPLTTQSMVFARWLLGKAGESVQLLGVDANPDATAVSNVLAYSRVHGMVNQWDFLTGSLAQLKKVWSDYHVAVQVQNGQIDHTPALFLIDQQGRLRKVYLTQMAYTGIGQSAQVLAQDISALLPGHPKLASQQSLATIPGQGPTERVSLRGAASAAAPEGSTVALGPGQPRLVVFFASWLAETSDLKARLLGLNAYATDGVARGLPQLAVVNETVTEASPGDVEKFLSGLDLDYRIGMDETGQVADGYGVQDQPWLTLVNAAGKITWSHDGWLSVPEIEAAVAAHSG